MNIARNESGVIALMLTIIAVLCCCSNCVAENFTQAVPDYSWRFPADHGQHPAYKTEWWYYTGHLYNEGDVVFKDKPAYGFQLTFFRRSNSEVESAPSEFMAHAALTVLKTGITHFSSRLGGGAIGISSVASESLNASSGDWTVDSIGDQLVLRFSVRGDSTVAPTSIRILTAKLPTPWLQGEQGFSKKAACTGCASMYYSMPRISLEAIVSEGSTVLRRLHGLAWMDHEFMSNSLADAQVGWDWLGLMLKDGRSVMLFHLRSKDNARAFASGGVLRGGDKKVLEEKDFSLTPISYWRSESSGARYPTSWRLQIPSEAIDIILTARTNHCEVGFDSHTSADSSVPLHYWEGPVASDDESVMGYLEMTGYAGKISGL